MNRDHLELLASDGWRELLRDHIVPFALGAVPVVALGDDVLEIGPGPGLTTDLLAADLTLLTALELDPVLAADLEVRYASDPTVVVAAGDASDMEFDDNRFSAVVSFTMLHHVPDRGAQDRLFAEVARVLAPGGLFVASDSVASDELAALHDGDIYNPVDPDELPARLTAAGFASVETRVNAFGWVAHARLA